MMLGIIYLDGSAHVTPEQRLHIRAALSRCRDEHIHEFLSDHAYVIKASTGALFRGDGFDQLRGDSICGIAGEPLLGTGNVATDQAQIAEDIESGSYQRLGAARGVFCGFHYSNSHRTLTLFADKLAIRPLYVWRDEGLVVFATAIRMLEALPFLRLTRDIKALVETVAYGSPLADRTRYAEVRLLQAGEIVRFTKNEDTRRVYWRWDDVRERKLDKHETATEAYQIFKEAIAIRARGDDEVVAYLSGGMDSRAIVAALRETGSKITTFNFSRNQSQDLVFARAFAEKVGCKFHHETRSDYAGRKFQLSLANRLSRLVDSQVKISANRPRAVWSGDGGSVGVGSVYIDQLSIELMRKKDLDGALRHFRDINNLHLPEGLIPPNRRSMELDNLHESFVQEIGRQQCQDAAQSLLLFLMVNDQRRHLNNFFEDLDKHRLEYQLPFFDSNFLEFVFSIPLDYRINHRFYTDWFELFPAEVRAVPWQTYPGHEPCPLPIPMGYLYQWDESSVDRRTNKSAGIAGLRLALRPKDLRPVSWLRLSAAVLMHLSGMRDYTYAIRAAHIIGCRDFDF